MNTTSASPAEPRPVLVWDAPLRVFHWLLAASFAGAWLTAESERWRLAHVTLGYTLAGLIVFRLAWGVVGPRQARFTSFVRGPSAVLRYLRSLITGHPEHHTGHNPAGALAVLALLGLGLLTALTGVLNDRAWGGHAMEELHEGVASTLLAVVVVHVVAVVVSSVLHRENLVRSMITGRKRGQPSEAIPRAGAGVALVLLAGVLGFWWLQWKDAPIAPADPQGVHARAGQEQDDD